MRIPEGATPPDLPAEPQLSSPLGPDIDPALFADIASRLFGDAVLPRAARARRS